MEHYQNVTMNNISEFWSLADEYFYNSLKSLY